MTVVAGRSVVKPVSHHVPAGLLAALATVALVLAPEQVGPTGLLVTVAVAQVCLIVAWSGATGTRGYLGSLLIGAGSAVCADTVLALQTEPDLGPLAAILAGAFLASMLHQLTRAAPRRLATASIAGISTLTVALVALSALLPLYRITDGSAVYVAIIVATGGALVAGHLVDLVLPRPRIAPDVPRGLIGLVVSVGTAVAAAVTLSEPGGLIESLGAAIVGAILGLVCALLAVAASYIAAERRQVNWSLPLLQTIIPIAGAAPIAYFLALQILA